MKKNRSQLGQSVVEYGLIIALISAVLIGALVLLRGNVDNTFSTVTSEMENP